MTFLRSIKLYIVGEQGIRVDHVLLGMPDAQIGGDQGTVCSHPQALAQCKAFLEEHPSWKKKEEENTAGAAKKVSEVERTKAWQLSQAVQAGELFGLTVLAENICRERANSTRFIIVSRKPEYEEKAGRSASASSCLMKAELFINMLSHFIYNGLSMTKIESRPIPGKTGNTVFCGFRRETGRTGCQKCAART